MGAGLRLALSHALFSSNDIDQGSRLLLKCLAAHGRMDEAASLLDSGCGTGVIGLALGGAYPGLRITGVDRDALALAFSSMNARANGLERRFEVVPGLLSEPVGRRFDRIVSNLPAKAGEPALRDFISGAGGRLEPGGLAGIVIVRSLAGMAREAVQKGGYGIVHAEEGPGHHVLIFGHGGDCKRADGLQTPAAIGTENLEPYERGRFEFKLRDRAYSLRSLRGIPDFDCLGHGTILAAKLLSQTGAAFSGPDACAMIVSPGQGHIPAHLALETGIGSFILAGRDLLALRASRRALEDVMEARGGKSPPCGLLHIPLPPAPDQLPPGFQRPRLIVAFPEDCPGFPWCQEAARAARGCLAPGGLLIIAAPSGQLSFLDKRMPEGFRMRADKREKGFRAALLAAVD